MPRRTHEKRSGTSKYFTAFPTDHEDPLDAWKEIQADYPKMAVMARDVLAVPLSSVGVERTFNMA
jgi:hypothetical protein